MMAKSQKCTAVEVNLGEAAEVECVTADRVIANVSLMKKGKGAEYLVSSRVLADTSLPNPRELTT